MKARVHELFSLLRAAVTAQRVHSNIVLSLVIELFLDFGVVQSRIHFKEGKPTKATE